MPWLMKWGRMMQTMKDEASLTRRRIRRLYRKHPGWSIRQAAGELGLSPSTVHKALQDDPQMGYLACECCGSLVVKVADDG